MENNTFQRRDLSKRLAALIFTGLSSVTSFETLLPMYVHVVFRCKSRVRNVLNASGEREHMYRRARHARRIRAKYVCYMVRLHAVRNTRCTSTECL